MKRFSIAIALVSLLALVFAGSAFANFGPHGGYIADTDACAGCHRAHTSFSNVRYTPRVGGNLLAEDEKPSALLVGSAATMSEFCNACHGDLAPGASTNVVVGLFDGGPSGSVTQTPPALNAGVITQYSTESSWGAPLNGGGFATAASLPSWEVSAAAAYKQVTSTHSMERVGVLWGAGNGSEYTTNLTCTGCHDPHGSSNYRLLKDSVNGVTVGGYTGNLPNGIVYSTETNYPYADNGWLKHEDGQLQMAAYKPNYTSGSTQIRAGTAGSSMSAWCSACHTRYNQSADSTNPADPTTYGAYEGGGAVGFQTRHRHPVDIALMSGDANLQVIPQDVTSAADLDPNVPLEVAVGNANPRAGQIGCLTCHFAHGSSATMTGWAAATLSQNASDTWGPERTNIAGVDPDTADIIAALNGGAGISGTSALLRADNRGVCERCHNK